MAIRSSLFGDLSFHKHFSAFAKLRKQSQNTSTPERKAEKKAKSPIEIKINDLYSRLESEGYGQGPHKLKMPLERSTFLEDAFKHIMSKSKKELQRNKFGLKTFRLFNIQYTKNMTLFRSLRKL